MQFGVSESIEHWGKYRPTKEAVSYNGKIFTYSELNKYVNVLCSVLSGHGISSSRIGIAIESKFYFLISLIAILRMGKSAVILNVGLPYNAILTNIKDTSTKTIIHDTERVKIKDSLLTDGSLLFLNIDDLSLSSKLNKESFHHNTTVFSQPSDEWGVVFSSGTTGMPKGIERDHESIITELLGWCLELGLYKHTKFYMGRPIYYTGGLALTLSTLLISGLVYLNDFRDSNNPIEIWTDYQNVLKNNDLTWAFFIPDQIRAFISNVKKNKLNPSSSKCLLTMGAPITGEEKIEVVKYLNTEIVESWGNSESLGTITDPEDVYSRPNSIGRPFLTDKMYIVDDDSNILKAEELGKISGHEEGGFSRYSNRPEETDRVKRNNLIISDDIGYIDKEGYFYVCGRRQDLIVTPTGTIFIPNLEDKMRKIISLYDCCVVAKTYDGGRFDLFAFIPKTQVIKEDEQTLLEKINKKLTEEEKLKRVIFIDEMPRLPSGKINKIGLNDFIEEIE